METPHNQGGTMNFQELYDALEDVMELIDLAPERHESTPKGHLADMDWQAIIHARSVVHRIGLWQRYQATSPESYLPGEVTAA
jgi:hypothetical protein